MIAERLAGCLLGGAAGDALGYTVEFWDEARIDAAFGADGITAYVPVNGAAEISDDTQMTMFTVAGLLAAEAQGTPAAYLEAIRAAYADWYLTQQGNRPLPDADKRLWLMREPALYARRAPGKTCLSAIAAGMRGTPEQPINHSKGCGGVMRVAPIGLYFAGASVPIALSDRLAAEAAALTHGHPLGWLPAAALAHMVRLAAEAPAMPLAETVRAAMTALEAMPAPRESVEKQNALLQAALALAQTQAEDRAAIHQLGEGWVGEEALAIAVFCAVKYETAFDRALIAAVNHRGDSDSTGAIAGQLLGARLGLQGIPQRFLDGLELKTQLLQLAQDCACALSGQQAADDWRLRYPLRN